MGFFLHRSTAIRSRYNWYVLRDIENRTGNWTLHNVEVLEKRKFGVIENGLKKMGFFLHRSTAIRSRYNWYVLRDIENRNRNGTFNDSVKKKRVKDVLRAVFQSAVVMSEEQPMPSIYNQKEFFRKVKRYFVLIHSNNWLTGIREKWKDFQNFWSGSKCYRQNPSYSEEMVWIFALMKKL